MKVPGKIRARLRLGAFVLALAALVQVPAWAQGRTIAVPWIQQKSLTDCGRAVLASLAGRGGRSPEAAYSRIPDPADLARGYSVAEMQRVGARVGVRLSISAPSGVVIRGECAPSAAVRNHFNRLARSIAAGRPVVVPVASGFGAGHYLILVGASGDSFTALDPASSGQRHLSTSELAALTCGYGYVALISR